MNSAFNFKLFDNLVAGVGATRDICSLLSSNGYVRVSLLVDEGVAKNSEYFTEILAIIQKSSDCSVQLLRASEEPDYTYLDSVAESLRSGPRPDVLIGIGGGSTLDITKACAVLMTNPGNGIDYRGFDKVQNVGVATVCIPTTAGSGSEVTVNAVFTDKTEKKKLGINGRYMHATHAILDAEWTGSCPYNVALSSGMDALTHTLESFSCRQHNDLTRVFSIAAFRILHENLIALKLDPANSAKRQNILLGAHVAAIALFNSGSGIAGAMSYPIGVHYTVPHGIAGAIFLASVVEYNINAGYQDYALLADAIGCPGGMTIGEKNAFFASELRELCETLGVPKYLNDWGINSENVSEVAALMLPLQGAFDQNPVPFSAERDAHAMLRSHVR